MKGEGRNRRNQHNYYNDHVTSRLARNTGPNEWLAAPSADDERPRTMGLWPCRTLSLKLGKVPRQLGEGNPASHACGDEVCGPRPLAVTFRLSRNFSSSERRKRTLAVLPVPYLLLLDLLLLHGAFELPHAKAKEFRCFLLGERFVRLQRRTAIASDGQQSLLSENRQQRLPDRRLLGR